MFLPLGLSGCLSDLTRQLGQAAPRSTRMLRLLVSSASLLLLLGAFVQSAEYGVTDPHHSPLGLTLASGPTRGGHSLLACDLIAGSASRRTVWPLPSPPL